ncbi:MAG TPA: cysteine--1-D-myo-inosityl 2-amino-2-deoxy-alpha-D-glucopyranoside ligase [Mycobacteriales bacterium]|nr:cysteine--1-D-myo-inosityl 2-amino-2-deoxy-alpha-D-glucopyranoside ligase [Mycobacteriales bacterium]
MQPWPATDVPVLPAIGSRPVLRLHDSSSGGPVAVEPAGTARLYVCGITPYDATHLGHAATYLAFDTLVRFWRDAGLQVRYAQNVTDVDDPLLERAARDGEDWQALAARETERFRGDMTALRVLPPDDYVGAVEAMPRIVDAVVRLRDAGLTYDVDGDLYFPVAAAARFGAVSGLDRDAMLTLFAERGGDPERTGKKDPLDALLWRAERPGEPAWDAPMGRGRPGWHVECAAIALDRLGPSVDVQGGGTDLVFPHHEHSAAEAEALSGREPFARAYVHAGMVGYQGEKMSKSLGNLVLVSALRADGVDPAALRLALLDAHYRRDREWTDELLQRAAVRLASWRAAVRRRAAGDASALVAHLRAALADDLDTVRAVAAVDAWAAADGDDTGAPALARDAVDALLGIDLGRGPA